MSGYPRDPATPAEALQTLADFARTAPGRLPSRVTVALAIADKEKSNQRRKDDMSTSTVRAVAAALGANGG